jgi:hypothetical protein
MRAMITGGKFLHAPVNEKIEAAMNDRQFRKHLQEIAHGGRPAEQPSVQQPPEPSSLSPTVRKPPAKAGRSKQRGAKKKAS